ncbi:N(6)-adenine-specific DNA methyltransferase [Marchantia polymorpha subsp. ruderalis]
MAEAEVEAEGNLSQGILEIQGANAVWLDPVAVLNGAYSQYQVSYSRYYSRPSFGNLHSSSSSAGAACSEGNTRKRKRKKTYTPNEKEVLAELRHKESRSSISHAHSSFLATRPPLSSSKATMDSLSGNCTASQQLSTLADANTNTSEDAEVDFVRLAELWQAPLYELNYLRKSSQGAESDVRWCQHMESRATPLFGSFVEHEEEALAECAGCTFILPRNCRFLMSDVSHIHQLIPEHPDFGYNLILIDPPWENKSVHRKSLYPTLPNRQLLSLPIKQLVHREGTLLALWLTNREKLHQFVEKELFPAWGVQLAASWYWLKLNDSGQMISPLDLQHHKPYECLLLGYLPGNKQAAYSDETAQEDLMSMRETVCYKAPPNKFVIMSIPGDHSRKPPLGSLLSQYAPGPHPVTGLELFARELTPGWTSWGNEPLRFQNLRYFHNRG